MDILDIVSKFAALITPILLFWLGNKYQRTQEIERNLREDRVDLYYNILEPFMLIWVDEALIKKDKRFKDKTKAEVTSDKILSVEYQEYAFKMMILGSDGVTRAFNNLLQWFYQNQSDKSEEADREEYLQRMFWYLGDLFLEIRKSIGDEKTKLHQFEMVEWKIMDIRKYKKKGKYPKEKQLNQ